MKIFKILPFFIILFFSIHLHSQTHVNKYILEPFGTPSTEVEWAASTADNNGNIITTGHTVISPEKIAMLITKQSSSGAILWETTWLSSDIGINKNYGVAIKTDVTGNVFVAGATTTNGIDNFDYAILKYSPNGNLLWSRVINGEGNKADIPASITTDLQNHVIVTGVSYGTNTETDYLTLRLNKNNGSTLWSKRYDNSGLFDIAVDVAIDDTGHPVVTGASSSNTLDWSFKTLRYKKNDGMLLNQNTIDTQGEGFETPKAIKKDNNGNLYITGDSNPTGLNQDIQVTKLDANLNELWTINYDGNGYEDGASSLQIDNVGSLYIVGYSQNKNQKKELLVLKYNSNGNLIWEQRRKPENSNINVIGKRSVLSDNGHLYVAGEINRNNQSTIVINKFTSDGKKVWEQRHSEGLDKVMGIKQTGESVFVFGKSGDDSGSKYYTIRLEELERNNPFEMDEDAKRPIYKRNELIVKFHRTMVNHDKINNLNITHGDLSYWLNPDAITELADRARIDTERTKLVRIFSKLKTTEEYSISRRGKTIPVPDFWASFLMVFPSEINLEETVQGLEGIFPTVEYAHPNYVAIIDTEPNDEKYLEKQHSLQNGTYPDANVNVETAWDINSGRPEIRTGVIDTGLGHEHEDFNYDDGGTSTSLMVDGWDFITGAKLLTLTDPDLGDHGTQMSGIIGAIKNNEKGVAGIAGGYPNGSDFSDPDNRGTSLYALRIFDFVVDQSLFISTDLVYVADAIFWSSYDNEDEEYGYALHVANNSWSFRPSSPQTGIFNNDNIQLVSQTVHFANRNQVVYVASRGNGGLADPFEIHYPACYNNDWVINVGGTGSDGGYKTASNGDDWFIPNLGEGIDIAAPSNTEIVHTTSNGHNFFDPDQKYGRSNGTSSAAAHVSGAAALLLSYWNGGGDQLAPEDVEFILEKTADNQPIPGTGILIPVYDDYTGYGKLNVGDALELIDEDSGNTLFHFDSETEPTTLSENFVETKEIELTEPFLPYPYYQDQSTVEIQKGVYEMDVYKITATIDHNLLGDPLLYSWERPSESTLFGLYGDEDKLAPHESVTITNINNNQAFIEGYVYHVKDAVTPSGTSDVWMPFDVTDYLGASRFTYSVIAGINTSSEDITQQINFEVIPNPTSGEAFVNFDMPDSKQVSINIVSINGVTLENVFDGKVNGIKNISINISNLPSGIYYVSLKTDTNEVAIKPIVKQ